MFLFILFNIAYWLWILTEINNFIISARNSGKNKRDKGSFWIIIIAIIFAIGFSFSLRDSNTGIFMNSLVQCIGVLMMLSGIVIRRWAITTLGKGFTVKVHAQKKGKLVTEGIYEHIRHPSYTGVFLVFTGLPLAMGTWLGAIIILAVTTIVYVYRMNVEEKALIEAYGKKYKEYMKKTKRLIPGVY